LCPVLGHLKAVAFKKRGSFKYCVRYLARRTKQKNREPKWKKVQIQIRDQAMPSVDGNDGDVPGPAMNRPASACPAAKPPPQMTPGEQELYFAPRKQILTLRGLCMTSLDRVERHNKVKPRAQGPDDNPQSAGACQD